MSASDPSPTPIQPPGSPGSHPDTSGASASPLAEAPIYANGMRAVGVGDSIVVFTFTFGPEGNGAQVGPSYALSPTLFRQMEDFFVGVHARRQASGP